VDELEGLGWSVELQNFTYKDTACSNIIATWGSRNPEFFVVGAHYDTRPHADQESDPINRTIPILGANDAASGVAIILELARVLPESTRPSIELVCFDAEDSGNIDGWDWIVGSNYYVNQLSDSEKGNITGMVLLDMVGGTDLVIPRERYSTRDMQDELWSVAATLGHDDVFVDTFGSAVLDDHRPFLDAGIPAVDIIQTPFPWTWHTLDDTPANCDPQSLQVVGEVVESFLVTSSGAYSISPPIDYVMVAIVVIPAIALVIYVLYRRK
jgi:Zn-dependent M28 family amino/carboxypeptidase